ncbi:MAG: hypothetical protein GQ545_03715 [Candidatus Aminicenantes bacterium]|nr:hypothetical protein [Candidatus Aminicenantes bacterium]
MEEQFQILDTFAIAIPTQKICVRIGYRTSLDRIRSSVIDSIEGSKTIAAELVNPRAICRILDYSDTNRHPIFEHAKKVALCICTIGPQIESESSQLMKRDEMMKALILDAIGSESVEQVARQVDRLLCVKAQEMNLWPSKRFSPGYKSWNIEEQRYIFRMIPGEDIGVTLNESFMMIPRKSVSFRINFYKTKELSTRSFR